MKTMHSLMLILVTLATMLTFTGCSTEDYTNNYKAYTARAATDLATTITAEEANLTETDLNSIATVAGELNTFLETGEISALTAGELSAQISAKIPSKYQAYFTAAMAYLSAESVDVDAAVPTNVLRMLQNAIYGVKTAAEKYVVETDSETE